MQFPSGVDSPGRGGGRGYHDIIGTELTHLVHIHFLQGDEDHTVTSSCVHLLPGSDTCDCHPQTLIKDSESLMLTNNDCIASHYTK